jgi:hypothetical protein
MDDLAILPFFFNKRMFLQIQIARRFENGLGFSSSFPLVFEGFRLYNKTCYLKVFALCFSPLVIQDFIAWGLCSLAMLLSRYCFNSILCYHVLIPAIMKIYLLYKLYIVQYLPVHRNVPFEEEQGLRILAAISWKFLQWIFWKFRH